MTDNYIAIDLEEGNYRFLVDPTTHGICKIMIRRLDDFGNPYFELFDSYKEKECALNSLMKEFISVRSKLNASYPAT